MLSFETDRIDELQAELAKLKEGCELLEEVWSWYGPYGPKGHRTRRKGKKVAYDVWVEPMPQELLRKLHRFFGFDDSE